MRWSSSAYVLSALAATVLPRPARADDYSIHVLGNVQTSWSDNLFAAAEDSDPLTAAPESDLNTQLRPGVLLSYETPRTIYQASYNLEANLYATHTEAWSITHLASLHGFFLTSPRSEVQGSATFTAGTLTALAAAAPSTQPPEQQQGGNGQTDAQALDLGQSLSYAATRSLQLTQGARARLMSTRDPAGNRSGGSELGLSAGADRGWVRSAVAVALTGTYVTLDSGPTSKHTINSSVVGSYRRDLSLRWTARLDGGVAAVIPLEGDPFVQPTLGLNLGYLPNWGGVGLQLRRTTAPNLYIAQNTVTDSAAFNVALPLPWLAPDINQPRLTTGSSIGINRTQQIIGDSLEAATDVINLDVALQYQARPGLGFALRAQHLRQVSEAVPATMSATPTVDYNRTTITLSATWRFPDRLAAELPTRDSLRVDRGGNTPVGEELAPSVAP